MKNKDEQTGLIGLAIGAAVMGLVAAQKELTRDNIVEELVRLGGRRAMGLKMRSLCRRRSWCGKGIKKPGGCRVSRNYFLLSISFRSFFFSSASSFLTLAAAFLSFTHSSPFYDYVSRL